METTADRAASVVIGLATALVIVAVALPLFLNPVWVAFEQGRAGATGWTGFTEPELRGVTDAILTDLVFGPPDFDVAVAGTPVLNERERGHMRDVRGVFLGFFAVVLLLGVGGVVAAVRRRGVDRARTWRSVRHGALALIGTLAIGGIVSLVAFDVLFETFHSIFFAGGSYTFDPATERLVQLFPFQFWQETAIAVGAVCIALAGVVAVVASGRTARYALEAREDATPEAAGRSVQAAGSSR